jgi:hypothetical protein
MSDATNTGSGPRAPGGSSEPRLDPMRLDCYRVAIEFQALACKLSRPVVIRRYAISSNAPVCRSH